MAKWDPLSSSGYLYELAADAIAAAIAAGEIADRLPAERDLVAELGVSYQTVRRALQVLRERGLVITRPGWGTFVAAPALRAGRDRAGRDRADRDRADGDRADGDRADGDRADGDRGSNVVPFRPRRSRTGNCGHPFPR